MSSFAAGAEQHDKLYDRSNASIGPIQNPAEWSSHAVSMGRWRGEGIETCIKLGPLVGSFLFPGGGNGGVVFPLRTATVITMIGKAPVVWLWFGRRYSV